MKGHLELYIAYVREDGDPDDEEDDTNAAPNNQTEEDWELITDGSNTQQAQQPSSSNMQTPQMNQVSAQFTIVTVSKFYLIRSLFLM